MHCSFCNTDTSGIRDGNCIWCDGCGHALKSEIQFVTGYCQSHSCRTQVYCRVKRFGKYISKICHDYSVLQRYHDILDLYSCFEFAWIRNRMISKRIYFFAKPVMLKVCCNLLKLETQDMPRLKDKLRELEQKNELMSLKETAAWRGMHAIKSGVSKNGS